jgi:hypothetical protein
MKIKYSNYLWTGALIILTMPLIIWVIYVYFGLSFLNDSIEKKCVIYSLFGFFPSIIIFTIINYLLNEDDYLKRILSIISVFLGITWVIHILYLVASGEFV